MSIRHAWRRVLLVGALLATMIPVAVMTTTSGGAQAIPTHGIGFAKGCDSPVTVGGPYNCGFLIANTPLLDVHGDTLTVTSLTDIVHAASGDIASGEILDTRVIAAYSDGAMCFRDAAQTDDVLVGETGAIICVLPTNSAVAFARDVLYTVQEGDLGGDGRIDDDATIVYNDLCTSGAGDCPIGPNTNSAGASAPVSTPTPTPSPTENRPTDEHADRDAHQHGDAHGHADQHACAAHGDADVNTDEHARSTDQYADRDRDARRGQRLHAWLLEAGSALRLVGHVHPVADAGVGLRRAR